MQIIKPLQLSSLHRTFTFCGKHVFSVGVVEAFRLDSGEPVMETDFWPHLLKILPVGQVFDTAMPKQRPEFLALARFYSAGGKPVTGGKAAIKFGNLEKTLYVFGDRRWRNIGLGRWTITDPVPFTEMPLDYAHAYGGKGQETNPEGRGALPVVDEQGISLDFLPNIEDPAHLITAPGDAPFPAGFSNIPLMWPYRLKKAGTYDERWQQERAPALADDIDWSYFNEAPADQWLQGPIAGNESFELQNLHPADATLSGRLPGHVARCFVRKTVDDKTVIEEITTRIDTVMFIPHENLGIIVHRGTTEVSDDMGRNLVVLMLAFENLHDPRRSFDHYETELIKRSDPAQAFKFALYTTPLIPEDMHCGFEEMQKNADFPQEMAMQANLMAQGEMIRAEAEANMKSHLAAQQEQFNEQLKAVGHPPIDLLAKSMEAPELDPALARVLVLIEEAIPKIPGKPGQIDFTRIDLGKIDEVKMLLDQYAADQQQKMRYNAKTRLEEALKAMEEAHGEHLGEAERKQIDEARAAMSVFDKPAPLPRPSTIDSVQTLRKQIEASKKQIEELRAMGIAESELPVIDCDVDAIEQQVREAAPRIKAAYLLGAHEVPWGAPPHAGKEQEIRAKLLEDWRAGLSVCERDLAGIDLSGLDLTGIDLSHCYLEDVNFEGATLKNAVIESGIMPRVRFAKADFSQSRLVDSNIGASDLSHANFSGVIARRTRFAKATLFETRFTAGELGELQDQFLSTLFRHTNFSQVKFDQPLFLELDMQGSDFSGAKMPNLGSFIGCNLQGVRYDGLQGHRLVWVDSALQQASFCNARLDTFCFVGKCVLDGVILNEAAFSYGNFRTMPMRQAQAERACMVDCDFSEADLTQAKLGKADLSRSQFMQSQLKDADFKQANLIEGSLFKAFLVGTRFDQANLYSVNFMQCTLGETRFDGANLDKTILRDWRP